jgi:hypothetical protein
MASFTDNLLTWMFYTSLITLPSPFYFSDKVCYGKAQFKYGLIPIIGFSSFLLSVLIKSWIIPILFLIFLLSSVPFVSKSQSMIWRITVCFVMLSFFLEAIGCVRASSRLLDIDDRWIRFILYLLPALAIYRLRKKIYME